MKVSKISKKELNQVKNFSTQTFKTLVENTKVSTILAIDLSMSKWLNLK